jgi:predicted ATPase
LLNGRAFDEVEHDQNFSLLLEKEKSRTIILSSDDKTELQPNDVGTGITQILPVVVTALDGSEMLQSIEQPELHIHPRMQAALGDLFIEGMHRKQHAFVIETHSEHLLLRLLRRIRETDKGRAPPGFELRTDEIAIYFLEQIDNATRARRIDVDINGDFIQPWPDDFFEIDFYERFTTGERT